MVFYKVVPLAKGVMVDHNVKLYGITNAFVGNLAEYDFNKRIEFEWDFEVQNEAQYYYSDASSLLFSRIIASTNQIVVYELLLTKTLKKPKGFNLKVLNERNHSIKQEIDLLCVEEELSIGIEGVYTIAEKTDGVYIVVLRMACGDEPFFSGLFSDEEDNENNNENDSRWEVFNVAVVEIDTANCKSKLLYKHKVYNDEIVFDHKIAFDNNTLKVEYKTCRSEYEAFPHFSDNWNRKELTIEDGKAIITDTIGKTTYDELQQYFTTYIIEEHTPSGYFKSGHYALVNKVTGETIIDTILKPGMYALRMYVDVPRIMVINIFDNKKKSNVAYVLQVLNGEITVDRVLDLDYYANIRFDEDNEAVIIENGNETIFITEKEL